MVVVTTKEEQKEEEHLEGDFEPETLPPLVSLIGGKVERVDVLEVGKSKGAGEGYQQVAADHEEVDELQAAEQAPLLSNCRQNGGHRVVGHETWR